MGFGGGRAAKNYELGYNTKDGLRAFRAACADVDRNPLVVSVNGTSITRGDGASDLLTTNYVSRIRKALQDRYGNVGQGNYQTPMSIDRAGLTPWWTLTGSWTLGSSGGIGGRSMYAGGSVATATLVFTGTEANLIYTKAANGSPSGVTVTIDGVTKTAPNFYAASNTPAQVQTYSGLTAGTHTMVITADPTAGKYCQIEDVLVKNPTVSAPFGAYVYNFGTSGSTAAMHSGGSAGLIAAVAPHLAIVELGLNDTGQIATWQTRLDTILANISASSTTSILLIAQYKFGDATKADAWASMQQYYYQMADKYNCALLDLYNLNGTYAQMATLGFWGIDGSNNGNVGSSLIHPSDKGHSMLADRILQILLGGGSVTIPTDLMARQNDYLYNANVGLLNWRIALAKLRSGSPGVINLNVVGDSTFEGTGAGSLSADYFNKSLHGRLRAHCTTKYGDVGRGFIPPWFPSGIYPAATGFWTWTGAWTPSSNCGPQYSMYSQTSGDTLTFPFVGTGVTLLYRKDFNSSHFTYSIDGGAEVDVNAYAGSVIPCAETVITGLSQGAHTVTIKSLATNPSTGYLFFHGAYETNAATSGIRVNMLSRAGSDMARIAQAYTWPCCIDYWAPSLVILNLGINDYSNNHDLTQFAANAQLAIDKIKAYSDCLIIPTMGRVGTYTYPFESYYNILKNLAFKNKIAMLDMWARWGSDTAVAQTKGISGDGVHPTAVGYQDLASTVIRVLEL